MTGPSATEYPRFWKTRTISFRVRMIGGSAPIGRRMPGREMSGDDSANVPECSADSALGLFGEARKRGCVVHRQVREDLAVQLNAGNFQTVDELAVAHPTQFGGGADADNPQRAVLALLLLAAGIGKLQRAIDGFFRRAVKF